MHDLWDEVPAGWPPALLQASLPSNGMAATASNTAATGPCSRFRDTTRSTNARRATTATLVNNTVPIATLLPSGRRGWTLPSVRRTGGHHRSASWRSPSCLTLRRKGASPLPPKPPNPRCLRHPELATKGGDHRITNWMTWAALLAATGHITWPSAGAFQDRHWAGLDDR